MSKDLGGLPKGKESALRRRGVFAHQLERLENGLLLRTPTKYEHVHPSRPGKRHVLLHWATGDMGIVFTVKSKRKHAPLLPPSSIIIPSLLPVLQQLLTHRQHSLQSCSWWRGLTNLPLVAAVVVAVVE